MIYVMCLAYQAAGSAAAAGGHEVMLESAEGDSRLYSTFNSIERLSITLATQLVFNVGLPFVSGKHLLFVGCTINLLTTAIASAMM